MSEWLCRFLLSPLYPKWKGYRQLPKKTEKEGIVVYYIPTRMIPGGFFFHRYGKYYTNALQKAVCEIHKEFSFDLIHCHTIYPDGYAGGKLKKEWKVPVVSTSTAQTSCYIQNGDVPFINRRCMH